jgi:hypothetical protein
MIWCCWSEVPGGSLLITGGGLPSLVESLQLYTVLLCSLLEDNMLQCITLHISTSLEVTVAAGS